MKWILRVLLVLIVFGGFYYAYESLQQAKYLKSIESQYPALRIDYSKSLIAPRKDSWMVWDIKEKDTTVNGGSIFDSDTQLSANLKRVCNPKEISYKNDIKVYDCDGFYGIFTLGYPPNPSLYGPFDR